MPVRPSRSFRSVDLRDVAVLVVDDNATNRHLLEGMLLGWRMAPTLAAKGNTTTGTSSITRRDPASGVSAQAIS